MKAVLSIELEVLEPAIVGSADQLMDLHPSQIRWVSIRLTADKTADDFADESEEEDGSITFEAQSPDTRVAIRNLVAIAQKSQPEGTEVVVWYQGRSERFQI